MNLQINLQLTLYYSVTNYVKKNTNISSGNLSGVYENRHDKYATPKEIVIPLSTAVDGFDLDLCSGAETIPHAESTYTKQENGLQQNWFGKVWVNPPYSQLDDWVDKIITEQENTEVIIALLPDRINADWFQKAVNHADMICFHDGCISFGDSTDTAPFGSIYLAFRTDSPTAITKQLNKFGKTLLANPFEKQTTL